MIGGFDQKGTLFIERRKQNVKQDCRFSIVPSTEEGRFADGFPCNHHCPHLQEPKKEKGMTVVRLCHGTVLRFEAFVDMRPNGETVLMNPPKGKYKIVSENVPVKE